jgi:hypothetical protein
MTLPTKLFHYSEKEIFKLQDNFYEDLKIYWPEEASMKPCGFWISVEESEDDINWLEWCEKEDFFIDNLKYRYSVTISRNAKILHLKTSEEVEDLSSNYPGEFMSSQTINWRKLKDQYDGIIISPYQWSARLSPKSNWYYPWDCSSGCIWNLQKIKIKLESIIDVEAIKRKASRQEEMTTDSLLANLVLSA